MSYVHAISTIVFFLGYHTNCLVIVGRIQPTKSTSTRHFALPGSPNTHRASSRYHWPHDIATWLFPVMSLQLDQIFLVPWLGKWYTRLIWKWKAPNLQKWKWSWNGGFVQCQWLVCQSLLGSDSSDPIGLGSQFCVIEKKNKYWTLWGQSSYESFQTWSLCRNNRSMQIWPFSFVFLTRILGIFPF